MCRTAAVCPRIRTVERYPEVRRTAAHCSGASRTAGRFSDASSTAVRYS